MKLNGLERAMMNNPVRAFLQRGYELPLLGRLGGRPAGACVLEVGCGRGVGAESLYEAWGAGEVHAFDLDPEMVALARRRLARHGAGRLRLWAGDVTAIDAADGSFDAVVDFGILHHVPRCQAAVAEIARVLRPGGKFYFEGFSRRALDRRAYRALFAHPRENRFSREEFTGELGRRGVAVEGGVVERLSGDFFFGVGLMRSEGRRGAS